MLANFCLSSHINETNYPQYGKVKVDNLNLRAGPNVNYNSLLQLMQDTLVIIVGHKYNWYKVSLPPQVNCYIKSNYLEIHQNKTYSKTDNLNIRSGPGFNFSVIGQIGKGEIVYIKKSDEEWTSIYPTQNSYGWVYSKYVKIVKLSNKEKFTLFKKFYNKNKLIERELSANSYNTIEKQVSHKLTKIEPIEEIENVSKKEIQQETETNVSNKVPEKKVPEKKVVGYIKDLGVILNRPGTHKLVDAKGNLLYYLESKKYDLDNYIYGKVAVAGEEKVNVRYKMPTLIVKEIKKIK